MLENFNAFNQLISLDFNIPLPHILLPLALSFVTFQQIAFLVDCYKNEVAEIKIIDYCLFICFFPQLIAGPIVHHKQMMPQFAALRNKKALDYESIAKGLFIFCIGLFKKVFIADSFAKWVNAGYEILDTGAMLNVVESWAVSLSYTFQIYFDFSGYCDMAIGLGLLFGIALPLNFNSPYKARNISEFWRRWHMTLGAFLRQYVYIPLGGNYKNKGSKESLPFLYKLLTLRNLFIVAFLSGVWHGAGWGFVIWGILHGIAMVIHRIYTFAAPKLDLLIPRFSKFRAGKFYDLLCLFITFNFINISWVFFRAEKLESAVNLIRGMIQTEDIIKNICSSILNITDSKIFKEMFMDMPNFIAERVVDSNMLLASITIFIFAASFLIIMFKRNSIHLMNNMRANIKNLIFLIVVFHMAFLMLATHNSVEFLYFNF